VDVLEVLSDTGLGREMHSVVSQGRVEAIVTSKPRERRLLIEEAAGLGKHRKRRRRAQGKLERTQENLDRALDVERGARSRLRPPRAGGARSGARPCGGGPPLWPTPLRVRARSWPRSRRTRPTPGRTLKRRRASPRSRPSGRRSGARRPASWPATSTRSRPS